MRREFSTLALAAVVVLCAIAAGAQSYDVPQSVVGSGGGEASGPDHRLVGTVGQSAIGVVSGPSNIHEIGFWYQPGWVLTEVEESDLLPVEFSLEQNQPNPFNPVTTIRFGVPEKARVTIMLYDVAGREVGEIANDEFAPGYHERVLRASGLSSGVYFCRMVSGSFTQSRKLLLLK
jgi:hypothetical protein